MGLPDPEGPFKLRAMNGEHKGLWLEALEVLQVDAPVAHIPNWEWVLRNRSEYKFVPNFTDVERLAYRYSFRKAAEIHRLILTELQIQTEIVARPVQSRRIS